ncbi:hypothetical protein [Polyangium sp. y55x31]|uniref:hypothetical protein n=1 Tax=Polyangium sp. y55x31 TaxID=3042688 RepID=UPI002482526D|nr:hypothetical protein [Polyangium sp. y55x31]MDI1476395.1 hypothetical protein [Polyangium sp. y55x31]
MTIREALMRVLVKDGDQPRLLAGDELILEDLNAGAITPEQPYAVGTGAVYRLKTTDLKLSIRIKKRAELVQWFEAEAPAERPKLTPYWPGTDSEPNANKKRKGYLLECMDILRGAGGQDDLRSPSVFNVTVNVEPTRELVAAIGTDYWEGATGSHPHRSNLDFFRHSRTFASHLYANKTVPASSPFTMLDCQHGIVDVWMLARSKGWKAQLRTAQKAPAPSWPSAAEYVQWRDGIKSHSDASAYVGAADIYSYLSKVGVERPGTVANFSVFSHAWAGGPILFNTFNRNNGSLMRDPADLDMRLIDFRAPNTSDWSSMPQAFASNATANIWGCFATKTWGEMVVYLARTKPTTSEPFRWHNQQTGSEELLTRAEVVDKLKNWGINNSYMKLLAQYINRVVYGGPPGYGSENMEYDMVPALAPRLKQLVHGTILVVPPGRSLRRVYESSELGSQVFNEFGYMRYDP